MTTMISPPDRPHVEAQQVELFQPTDLMKIAEVAALFCCNTRTIKRYIARGDLETLYSGSLLRVTKRSVAAYQQRTRRGRIG